MVKSDSEIREIMSGLFTQRFGNFLAQVYRMPPSVLMDITDRAGTVEERSRVICFATFINFALEDGLIQDEGDIPSPAQIMSLMTNNWERFVTRAVMNSFCDVVTSK